MTQPVSLRTVAEGILGPVRWVSETRGFCKCPGEAQHTMKTGPKHCQVNIDGAPTIHCFHASCEAAVAQANLELRRGAARAARGISRPAPGRGAPVPQGPSRDPATAVQERLRKVAPKLLTILAWPYEAILASSPVPVANLSAEAQYHAWLGLWPPAAVVWIGQVTDTGKPKHRQHFKPASEWAQRPLPPGNFTCPSHFRPGSFSRGVDCVAERRFLVVESDTLTRDEVGAVFRFVHRRLSYELHCIVDTGGKSLHAWFSPPPRLLEPELKQALSILGCDPKMFGPSQPCRVPGALRDDRLQRLIWLRN